MTDDTRGEVKGLVDCSVAEMKTSAGSDFYVMLRMDGREITPHMFKIRGRAEYEVAAWKHFFGQGPEPDILAFDTSALERQSTVAGEGDEPVPLPMESAPKDHTWVRLLVDYSADDNDARPLFDSDKPSWTIGYNGYADTGEDDEWVFVGWDWDQDCIVETRAGKVIGWLPFHPPAADRNAPRTLTATEEETIADIDKAFASAKDRASLTFVAEYIPAWPHWRVQHNGTELFRPSWIETIAALDDLVSHSSALKEVGVKTTHPALTPPRILADTTPAPTEEVAEWIEREFAGYGVALSEPLLGEPLMSMEIAKELTRRAVATFASVPAPESRERKLEALVSDIVKAVDSGNLKMESMVMVTPLYPWHDEWLHHARAALARTPEGK
jgi:hypothetical protein